VQEQGQVVVEAVVPEPEQELVLVAAELVQVLVPEPVLELREPELESVRASPPQVSELALGRAVVVAELVAFEQESLVAVTLSFRR
jgi:hypothetical protein